MERIKEILRGTGRKGIDSLIDAMETGGFFEAPCSGKYHLCEAGGLAEHTLNVYDTAMTLTAGLMPSATDDFKESVAICSILHDLGKMGDHGKPNYVENILKSGKQSEAEPYKTNTELLYEEHEIRSVVIAERYIELTEEEEGAILHHNGLFGKLDSAYGSHGYDRNELAFIIHTADMFASRFVETKEKKDE